MGYNGFIEAKKHSTWIKDFKSIYCKKGECYGAISERKTAKIKESHLKCCVTTFNDLSRNSDGVWSLFNITGRHYRCSLPPCGFNEYLPLAPATNITQTKDAIMVTAATLHLQYTDELSRSHIRAPALLCPRRRVTYEASSECEYCALKLRRGLIHTVKKMVYWKNFGLCFRPARRDRLGLNKAWYPNQTAGSILWHWQIQ